MGIDLPEPLRWLFKLTGSEWPDADEDKIAAFGEHVGAFGDRLDSVNATMVETVRLANVSNAGPAMTQYTANLRDVVDNGMPGMSVGARAMAEEIHEAALQCEYSKGTAVINMAIMAPMIAEAIASAPETFGATMAVAEAGIAAVRTTVPKLLTQMVEKVVTNTAMMEAGDLAVQGYQVLLKRDRAGFDGSLTLNTVEMGAIGGAVDGALTGALMKTAPKFFKSAEAGLTDADRLIWAPPKLANMATQVANNTVTSLIIDGINGAPVDGLSLLEGAGLGAAMGGLHHGPGAKPVDIVVPHGSVETGPYGTIRITGTDDGTGFRMVHPDGTVEHLGSVYDPRQTVGDPIVGGEPPEARVTLAGGNGGNGGSGRSGNSGGEEFVSKETMGDGDCTIASLADSALSQGVPKKSLHATGLNLSDPGDLREFRNRIADEVAAKSTDTRPGSVVLLGELTPESARTVLDHIGPPKASSSSHIDALDLATAATKPPHTADPIRDLTERLEQDPATVLSALHDHYSADGDKGMAQLTAYAMAKVEAAGALPRHRDLLDYAIRERTLAETPLGGEMLQAVAHALDLDVVVVSADKPAFHLNADAVKRVHIHRVTTEDGRNHYRALRPVHRPKSARRTANAQAAAKPAPRVPVSSRGGHGAITRKPTGSVSNALHRLAGGAHSTSAPTVTHHEPHQARQPHPDVSTLMHRAGHAPNAPARPVDGFESTAGPDVMGVRTVPGKPDFLTSLRLDDLPPDHSAEFFTRIDLARPDGPPTDLAALFTAHQDPQTPPRIPHLLHSIWLGGPLHDDGANGDRTKFMRTMAANAETTGFTCVLWTDVPRAEIDAVRSLAPDALTSSQKRVQEMLTWAETSNVKLVNVDEVFAGADQARLHEEIATERARTTGSGYAGASDLLRLDILHRFGGVYTDGDNQATAELARLVEQDNQAAEAGAGTESATDPDHGRFRISDQNGKLNNSAFIAPPGNRIVDAYRASLKSRYATPLLDLMALRGAKGNVKQFETYKKLQAPLRLAGRNVRAEVINRTGPTSWSYDRLATELGAPTDLVNPRHWFRTITDEHLATGSESSWLTDATQPTSAPSESPASHSASSEHEAPAYLEPEKAVRAAVTILHREAVNREGALHLPSVMDVIAKAAPEHQEHIWHAVLHIMDETWPADRYRSPDIVLSGRFQLPTKRVLTLSLNQSVPHSVGDYLRTSGLFPKAVLHTAVGHEFNLPTDRHLKEVLTKAKLPDVTPEQGRDIARVHELLFGDAYVESPERAQQAAKLLDLLHAASPGDSRTDPLWTAKALRTVVEIRIGEDGNYTAAHLPTLLADHKAFLRRGDLTPAGYRRHAAYAKAIPQGKDPDKFAATMSSRPPTRTLRKLSPAQHADRWDRAVDVMSLATELGGLTPYQERGLWKLVGLFPRTPGDAASDRPLTLHDMERFRDQLIAKHPSLGAITDPKAWTLHLAERAYALSPESGKVSIADLAPKSPDAFHAKPYPEPPEILRRFQLDAAETLRQYDELGPLVSSLSPAHFRDLITRAGSATEHSQRYALLRQLHINIASLQPDSLRVPIQGSRFHRHLSDELRKYVPGDPQVDIRDLPAFHHYVEADRFRAEYVEVRPDGSGLWIRDPRSAHDMGTHGSSRTMLPDPGHFTVILHGSPQRVHVGTADLTARDMANFLRQTPEWRDNPRPIRMISCNTGEHDSGFAQQLADELGVEVKAPNTVVWGPTRGKPFASTLVHLDDGTVRPIKQVDGAYRVFSPRTANPDGSARRAPIRLDTDYSYLGRKPALTVLSRAIAGSFGDTLAGTDPATRKIVNDWRHLMAQTGGTSQKAFEVSEVARDALDKVLSTDTIRWMFQHAPAGTEVNQALHVLAGSRLRTEHGASDVQPPELQYSGFAKAYSLDGQVPAEGLTKLAEVNAKKFPNADIEPDREPQASDFADLVHQLLGPSHDVEAGVATLAKAATRAYKPGSLSSLDAALPHKAGDFVRAPWARVRYEAYVPWADRHAIERDAALIYHQAFGAHAPARPDAETVRNMRRAVQVAKLAHASYDRRGQSDPEAFYRQLGDRLRPLADESGTGAGPFQRLLAAAGSGDGWYQHPDFLAAPMRHRLAAADVPRPPLGHTLAPEHLTTSRAAAKLLPGLFTPTAFGDHEQIEARLQALIPGRGRLVFEVGLPTELREGFGAMVDGGLTLRVTRDGHAYDVRLKALLKGGPEPVEESGGTAKNESRMFRTGGDGAGSHGTSHTRTVDAGVKAGFGPLSLGANAGTSRLRSREVTSSEAFGGDMYFDPADGTRLHTVLTQVHIEVTDAATGRWIHDVPPEDGPVHAVELRIQEHLSAGDGIDATAHAVTRALDDPLIDHLLGERTGYGEQLKHEILGKLHGEGLRLDDKARADLDVYLRDLTSPHNVAALHSADPLRRAGLTTSIRAKDAAGRAVTVTIGAHAEAKTLTQVSASVTGLKMDAVSRHAVKQGVSTGRGGGLPAGLCGTVKSPDGSASAGVGFTGASTRTETASLESAFSVTRTVRAEDESASYRLASKLDLHVAVDGVKSEDISIADATAWIRLRPGDRRRLIGADSGDGAAARVTAVEDANRLGPHLMTSHGLPLGQVKKVANLDGLYRDLVAKLADHLPEAAADDLATLFDNDAAGSFLHGTDDKHENWRRIISAVSGPGLAQRADALTGEGVTVKLRIDGDEVPLRLSLGDLKPAEATCLGADDKLMPISIHQASQASKIRSSRQQDLALSTSLGVGKNHGLFSATISGRRTTAARSTVSGGVRQYTRSLSGATLFDVGGTLSWKLEQPGKPLGGSVDGRLHLWVSTDLVKATAELGEPQPLRSLADGEHSALAATQVHMAVAGGGLDALRAEIAKKNPDLAGEFGNGRFAAELPLLTGCGVRVAPGVHWDVTPIGRPQVLKTVSVYVESHGEAGSAVDHDVETRGGKGGSGFGGGAGDGLGGGGSLSHSQGTSQGSGAGRGESSTRLMTAKKVQMALVRTRVRHRVTGVGGTGRGGGGRSGSVGGTGGVGGTGRVGGRPIETVGETLLMVPLSELHNRQAHFDFPADTPATIFKDFTAPGPGAPSPALKSGLLFGPVGAHPDSGLGLEASDKAAEAFGDPDLSEQIRDLLQTPTLASQIRTLTDGGLTHPLVTTSGARYELRIQAKAVGRPLLHDTNTTGGAKLYNAEVATANERSGTSKTSSASATLGIDTSHVTATATHTRSGTSGDVQSQGRRDVNSGGLRFLGESIGEYRQEVEYTYTITRISHPMWNLHFGDRPPETLRKSVGGTYTSEVRVFEPATRMLDVAGSDGLQPSGLPEHAFALDWHGQQAISTLFREAGGGTEHRHAPLDAAVLTKATFAKSLANILKPAGAKFDGIDLGGRTLMMKRGVQIRGTLKPPKSVARLKAGAERESFSHRDVSTGVEHSESRKRETKGQVSVSGVTPGGATVGGRAGIARATEERHKTGQTDHTETRPRWDRQPAELFAVHVPLELKLDFGRGGAARGVTVDVLVHVDAAGAEALGVPAATVRELRGEAEGVSVSRPEKSQPQVATSASGSPALAEPVLVKPALAEPVLAKPALAESAPIDLPIDDTTRKVLGKFTPAELDNLEHLARTASADDFQRLSLRASLSPGTYPEAALLERVPGLLSREHVLQAVREVREGAFPLATTQSA